MRLPHGADLPLPAYQSAHAAGLDLIAAVPADAPVIIAPGGRAAIPTGIADCAAARGRRAGPAAFRPRARHGVTVLNAPGTIDADYRGEIQVILVNFGQASFAVERGVRIAQLVFAATMQARFAKPQVSMKLRGELGVLVLRAQERERRTDRLVALIVI